MGYQGGRRYGDGDRNWTDWDRDSDRYRARRDWRDDRSYRYGTRGQFGGPGTGYGGAGKRGPDRESVVEGKSVSVRVDLGGRWNSKKKTQTPIEHRSKID